LRPSLKWTSVIFSIVLVTFSCLLVLRYSFLSAREASSQLSRHLIYDDLRQAHERVCSFISTPLTAVNSLVNTLRMVGSLEHALDGHLMDKPAIFSALSAVYWPTRSTFPPLVSLGCFSCPDNGDTNSMIDGATAWAISWDKPLNRHRYWVAEQATNYSFQGWAMTDHAWADRLVSEDDAAAASSHYKRSEASHKGSCASGKDVKGLVQWWDMPFNTTLNQLKAENRLGHFLDVGKRDPLRRKFVGAVRISSGKFVRSYLAC